MTRVAKKLSPKSTKATSTRSRRTRAQMDALRRQIVEEMRAHHPQSVRHCFYRMTDPRLPEAVPKSENGHVVVQRQLVHLRRQPSPTRARP